MAGLNETQRAEVRGMIQEGLTLLAQEQQTQLTNVRQELVNAGHQFETQNNEFRSLQTAYALQVEQKQQAMVEYLENVDKQRLAIGNKLDAEFAQKQGQIDRIMQEIAAKQADTEAMKSAIDVVIARAQEGLQQQGDSKEYRRRRKSRRWWRNSGSTQPPRPSALGRRLSTCPDV